ncbi:MAG: hypothetical protein KIT22_11950 [Verrucomicrobiae bacterium]|nr:hypothetical protein [Verrucomicrobiae bacterium]
MHFLRYFLYILFAALLSAAVGGCFAFLIGHLSPEFVKNLFSPPDGTSLPRYAAAVGAIWGVFIGAAVMGFSLGLVTLAHVARVLARKTEE